MRDGEKSPDDGAWRIPEHNLAVGAEGRQSARLEPLRRGKCCKVNKQKAVHIQNVTQAHFDEEMMARV